MAACDGCVVEKKFPTGCLCRKVETFFCKCLFFHSVACCVAGGCLGDSESVCMCVHMCCGDVVLKGCDIIMCSGAASHNRAKVYVQVKLLYVCDWVEIQI